MKFKPFHFLLFFALASSLLTLGGCHEPSLMEVDREVYRPYLWGYTSDLIKSNAKSHSLQEHPLYLARHAFAAMYLGRLEEDSTLIKTGRALLDSLLYYPHIDSTDSIDLYLYPFRHNELEAGWWSGMANGSVALAYLMGAQTFDEEEDRFMEKAERAIRGVTSSIQEKGSGLETPKHHEWYLEYSHPDVTNQNAYFVMNGFLYGLLSVKLFDQMLPEQGYAQHYQAGLGALQEYNKRFFYPDSLWTFYMLQPLTPESMHYCIYDLLLFECLGMTDTVPFYQDQVHLRRGLLEKAYPVYEEEQDKGFRYMFSHLGPPHPYWLDTYPVGVQLYQNGQLAGFMKNPLLKKDALPFAERAFLFGTLDVQADSFRVYSVYHEDSLLLYATTQAADTKQRAKALEHYQVSPASNGVFQKGQFGMLPYHNDTSVHSKYNMGSWEFLLDTAFNLEAYPYLGFHLNAEVPVKSILISLQTTDSVAVSRYYLRPIPDQENLILVHWTGFRATNRLKVRDISSFSIYLYTDKTANTSLAKVDLTPIMLFPDQFTLQDYFAQHTFAFPEKTVHSKLY